MYDFLYPVLVSATLLNKDMTDQERVEHAVNFVNFYSTPHLYERHKGLGTGDGWRFGSTIMLKSGNLLCSEQSALAAIILDVYYPLFRFRNIRNHTYHETRVNNRWVIIDPYANFKLKNKDNKPASYNDIQAYLKGEAKLEIQNAIIPDDLKRYLQLYKYSNSTKDNFDKTYPINYYSYSEYRGWSIEDILEQIKKDGRNLSKKRNLSYLLYIRNNVAGYIYSQKNTKLASYNIQDYFFSLIKKSLTSGKIVNATIDNVYFARGYQTLGRYKKALAAYNKTPESERINFYKSQCYFKLKDKMNFNKYKDELKGNPFYRDMYYRLNNKYLYTSDKDFFEKFIHR